ncbi:hypothetical protein AAVH_43205, partial [Aphelenchoides avenae]
PSGVVRDRHYRRMLSMRDHIGARCPAPALHRCVCYARLQAGVRPLPGGHFTVRLLLRTDLHVHAANLVSFAFAQLFLFLHRPLRDHLPSSTHCRRPTIYGEEDDAVIGPDHRPNAAILLRLPVPPEATYGSEEDPVLRTSSPPDAVRSTPGHGDQPHPLLRVPRRVNYCPESARFHLATVAIARYLRLSHSSHDSVQIGRALPLPVYRRLPTARHLLHVLWPADARLRLHGESGCVALWVRRAACARDRFL